MTDEDLERQANSVLWQCITELSSWHRILEDEEGAICEGCTICVLIKRAEETAAAYTCLLQEKASEVESASSDTVYQKIRKAIAQRIWNRRLRHIMDIALPSASEGNGGAVQPGSSSGVADGDGLASQPGGQRGLYVVKPAKDEPPEDPDKAS